MPSQVLLVPASMLALLCTLCIGSAFAETYTLTATGAGIDAVATLMGTPDPNTPGAFDFTSGSGTLNGIPLTLYTPSGTSTRPESADFSSPPFSYASSWEYDNVGYPTGNGDLVVDPYGFLFSEAGDHFNVFSVGQNYGFSDDEIAFDSSLPLTAVTLTTANTPEPSTVVLFCTGLLGVMGVVRKRPPEAGLSKIPDLE